MNVVVCVKQIPDPADPGALDADHTLKRDGKLILDESDSYGVEMALQLVDKAGGGEVTLVSMAPNGEVSGLRTALAMGAAKAILVSTTPSRAADALDTAKVLAAAIKRARARPGARRHRVVRRLHGHRARADRRRPRPAVGHLRQVGRRSTTAPSRSQRQTEAGYDESRPAARRRLGDRRCGRAPLPLLQGDHGRQVQAGRHRHRRRPRHRRRSSAGPAPARRSSTSRSRAREAGEVIEDDGEAFT
jgi:hypothetical protein